MDEELSGGNTTRVVRRGDTVRRAAGAWTPAVHGLLRHLERVGFEGSPRVIGIDGDTEVLRYVAGAVGTLSPEQPLAAWFRSPAAVRSIGRWLREFHAAQNGFRPDPALPWRRAPGRELVPGEVIVHHDVSSYNTVRRDDGSLVVLDWDFCRPGDPLEDLAWAAWRWVPLMAPGWEREYGVPAGSDTRGQQRANLAALMEGYAPTAEQRRRLPDAIEAEMRSHADALEDMARTDPAFAALIDRDYASGARRDADWWCAQPELRRLAVDGGIG